MSGFLKAHKNAQIAAEAYRRSVALRAAGVPTPAAAAGPRENQVCFERIRGETGAALSSGNLTEQLAVVSALHRTQVPGLNQYDPFLRVRPRLNVSTRLPVRDLLAGPVPVGSATLHGDLHVGQFIRDQHKKTWIVDLDDLAIGPPEADVANFAAHLATSNEGGIIHWSERVLVAWRTLSLALDDEVFNRFLHIALLRRHLKLREAGRPDFEAEILAYLRDSSNFSIR